MQYTVDIKEHVRKLRMQGLSLNQIVLQTNIPKATISTWITDIHLTELQLKILQNRTQTALQAGRIKAQASFREQRLKRENELFIKGQEEVGLLTKRDLFIAGIALYWAEGFKNKHEHRLGFCNSDPHMVRFYLHWLENVLNVSRKDIVARLTLNISYKEGTNEVEKYWSEVTGIPLDQFTKPFYQNTRWKKQNNTNNYKGVLRIHVRNSVEYLLQMKGWIEGLKVHRPG